MKKQLKLLVLQGIPASGKSTFAKEFIKEKLDWVIVSRDEIRESTGTYWVPERENYISVLENNAILEAFNHNLNVIIDATNLNPKSIDKWKELAKKQKVEIEFKRFEISLEEALQRDNNRKELGKRFVGEKVLTDFYTKYISKNDKKQPIIQYNTKEYLEQDITLPKAVIVDIDGTVALMNGRSAFQWDKVDTDLPNQPVIDIIHSLHPNIKIIFLSGREGTEICRSKTIAWINSHFNLPSNYELYMRNEKDFRGDEIIKRELFNSNIYNQYNVIGVFDDRNKVVNMWRKIGLLCLQVEQGDF